MHVTIMLINNFLFKVNSGDCIGEKNIAIRIIYNNVDLYDQ